MFGIPIAVILGTLSGLGINALGAVAGPKAILLRTVLPLVVQLAQNVMGGSASDSDSRTTADALLKATGQRSSRVTTGDSDGKTDSAPAATQRSKKR